MMLKIMLGREGDHIKENASFFRLPFLGAKIFLFHSGFI